MRLTVTSVLQRPSSPAYATPLGLLLHKSETEAAQTGGTYPQPCHFLFEQPASQQNCTTDWQQLTMHIRLSTNHTTLLKPVLPALLRKDTSGRMAIPVECPMGCHKLLIRWFVGQLPQAIGAGFSLEWNLRNLCLPASFAELGGQGCLGLTSCLLLRDCCRLPPPSS